MVVVGPGWRVPSYSDPMKVIMFSSQLGTHIKLAFYPNLKVWPLIKGRPAKTIVRYLEQNGIICWMGSYQRNNNMMAWLPANKIIRWTQNKKYIANHDQFLPTTPKSVEHWRLSFATKRNMKLCFQQCEVGTGPTDVGTFVCGCLSTRPWICHTGNAMPHPMCNAMLQPCTPPICANPPRSPLGTVQGCCCAWRSASLVEPGLNSNLYFKTLRQ